MEVEPVAGDFAVVSVDGPVGNLIRLGEWLNGHGFDQYQHAFIYIGHGRVVQAEPGGAADRPLEHHRLELWSTGRIVLTPTQRTRIITTAVRYVNMGTPYGFADYLELALHRFHIPAPGLRDAIDDTRSMICSQLVDRCYRDAGVQLFSDRQWPGYVTPADLAGVLEAPYDFGRQDRAGQWR